MPQLDRIIIFTQIFWLFLVFASLYTILIYFFFPIFLRSLKSRNLVIDSNSDENNSIKTNFLLTQTTINTALNEQMQFVRAALLKDFVLFSNIKSFDLRSIDALLLDSIFYTTMYSNEVILRNIYLNSKI
uniref:ATP synthase F0 subunit 8 n=1 Tax=Sheathia arcuata TaxID=340433 RepID=A0A1Z1XA79_9FLOR|nr:ATP synthase F0 subunit 8 [Sheathia arcuata]ARX95759.1 ATP synthase F0 subunit 8 [Sheathia arcuata]